ncbi:hypothetical protein SEA_PHRAPPUCCINO_47 [Mycobacterium phage Phrappuccino]|uniref:Uncharacterized protein n=1 Tax=Mycobacterium phage Phrappuccino TaxID=2591223 RepID=A0A514DE53_9CAUD|nr:hypothetical protein KHQ87_gp047 [Mycobacterium phage Phrappuccino]QDH91877.1 hypothetical protein SEA_PHRAPPUCCINO_47 [Mycobacterium phage Phrappuccino]QIQ63348.1 hypothetical protein SEA_SETTECANDELA_47 [Mycobacterium phage Settecandela]
MGLGDYKVVETVQYGVRLPNGTVSWGELGGHNLNTAEGRAALLGALRASAENLGFSEEDLLRQYRWTTRRTTVLSVETGDLPITDQSAFGPVGETGDDSGNESSGGSDGGAVREGPVGGSS